ncbi:MAG: hypothetical protein KGJ06_04065 [Pseudomonadota bacterium]|nr:hypothetical protein [Pseudomonadota bacterium]
MTSLSSLSKAFWLNVVVVAAAVAGLAASVVFPGGARIALAAAAVLAPVSLYYMARVRKLVAQVSKVGQECARGNMESRIIVKGEEGDLRAMVKNVNDLVDIADAYVRESRATLEHAAAEKYYRKIMLTGMLGCWRQGAQVMNDGMDAIRRNMINAVQKAASRLEATVKKAVDELAGSTNQLQATSRNLSGIAETGSAQAKHLAHSSDDTSQAVSTVAAAVEEFSASINDINKQVNNSSSVAREAVESANKANSALAELMESAEKIGRIVELINAIASQINLLALNATIEAARAGDAGKGFAVVASEVKSLATQTAKATAEITESISVTREGIEKSVSSVQEIGGVVNKINEAATAIAAAMEEQSAVTQDISRSIQKVARNASEISSAVNEMSEAAARTGEASQQMNQSSDTLAAQSGVLRKEIDMFISSLAA